MALGAPFLRISWGGTDARTLPAASTVRQVSEALDSQFPANSTAPIEALVTGARAASPAELTGYLHRIDAIPGVTGAQVTGVRGDTTRDIGYAPATVSAAARHIVTVIRVLLVPATMRLLGRANWWAPRPLRRLYGKFGIREETPAPAPVPAGVER